MSQTALVDASAALRASTTELVVLDLAGTTVCDDGVGEHAFRRAHERTGLAGGLPWEDVRQFVRDSMGQSRIDVFTQLAGGDRARAEEATSVFESAYSELIAEVGIRPIPGAPELLRDLRAAGIGVVLTTGFSPVTRDLIIDGLGWRGLIDEALSPVDVGRGRPAPDLVLGAALLAQVSSVARIVVVGDTASDVSSGLAAGAGLVAGVLSGAHDRRRLEAAGAHVVLDDVTGLRPLLGLPARGR